MKLQDFIKEEIKRQLNEETKELSEKEIKQIAKTYLKEIPKKDFFDWQYSYFEGEPVVDYEFYYKSITTDNIDEISTFIKKYNCKITTGTHDKNSKSLVCFIVKYKIQ